MQKITPFLWFNNNAEEAINHYTAIFKNATVGKISRYPEGGPAPAGSLMTATFTLNNQEFIVLNGGPMYKFTEAISFVVNCETQEEVDHFWNNLSQGGQESRCGWLKDKFGLSWQIVPTALPKLMSDPNPARARNVMQAMMKMSKIIIADLEKAAAEA